MFHFGIHNFFQCLFIPVKKGDQIGEVIYRLNEKTIGSVPVYATEGVGELTFGGAFLKILEEMMV